MVDFGLFEVRDVVEEWNGEHSDKQRQHSHKQQEAEAVRLIGAEIYARRQAGTDPQKGLQSPWPNTFTDLVEQKHKYSNTTCSHRRSDERSMTAASFQTVWCEWRYTYLQHCLVRWGSSSCMSQLLQSPGRPQRSSPKGQMLPEASMG